MQCLADLTHQTPSEAAVVFRRPRALLLFLPCWWVLIVFGNEPYLQAPFTRDHEVVQTLLGQTRTRMAGVKTAIGDAIGLALKHFESSNFEQRVLILLTDGNDTGSKVPPRKAAEIASQRGMTIHTVAVGDPMAAGEERMDIEALQAISSATGGSFFRADERVQLDAIYRKLDEIEPERVKAISYRPKYPLFQWPVGTVLLTFLAYHLLMSTIRRSPRGIDLSSATTRRPG